MTIGATQALTGATLNIATNSARAVGCDVQIANGANALCSIYLAGGSNQQGVLNMCDGTTSKQSMSIGTGTGATVENLRL